MGAGIVEGTGNGEGRGEVGDGGGGGHTSYHIGPNEARVILDLRYSDIEGAFPVHGKKQNFNSNPSRMHKTSAAEHRGWLSHGW